MLSSTIFPSEKARQAILEEVNMNEVEMTGCEGCGTCDCSCGGTSVCKDRNCTTVCSYCT